MKIYVRSQKRREENERRGELVVDVGGLSEWEAEDFVEQVKRRVTIKKKPKRTERCGPCGDPPRGGGAGQRRQVIDVNINVNR